jgi:hypothetical protein
MKSKVKKEIDELIDPNGNPHRMVIFVTGIWNPLPGKTDDGATLREQIENFRQTHSTGATLYHHMPYTEGVTVECIDIETAERLIKLKTLPMEGVEVSPWHWNIFDVKY